VTAAGDLCRVARRSLTGPQRLVQGYRVLRHEQAGPRAPGDLVALTPRECLLLLERGSVGRLGYVERSGAPGVVLARYVLDDGALVLRTAHAPTLRVHARRGVVDLVAFEVDEVDEGTRTGWSVLVLGAAQPSGGAIPPLWRGGGAQHCLRVLPRRTVGRVLL
jgi:hypothetical protein